ncbi:MAG: hypothetical protein SNG27_05405 [Rikenellaceae bacterium]
MNRGKISIQYRAQHKDVVVDIQFVDNNVWLAKSEIAELFNVYTSALAMNLRHLKKRDEGFYDANVLNIHIPNSDCTQVLYSLNIIIELAFRINGGYCREIRQWFCQQFRRNITSRQNYATIIPMKVDNQILN